MSALAAIRPDDWHLPLFLHVLAAFALVGILVVAASFLFAARRDGSPAWTRRGYRTLLFAGLPAFLATRISAQWLLSEEGLEDSEDAWITIGFLATDIGLLALLGATIAAGVAARRAGGRGEPGGRGVAIAAWLATLLVALYAVVIWTMATKPA